MNIEMLGKQIAQLRRKKGVTQEELAKYVGVSTQAVSKWENGGAPDVEILPKIADFFTVPIDELFNRSITDYTDLQASLIKKIQETTPEQQFKTVLNYCWDIERALYPSSLSFLLENGHFEDGSIEDYENKLEKQDQRYSSILSDHGFTRMGIANKLQYFLLVPEIQDTNSALFEGVDYLTFFRDFSDKDVFDACVFLNRRENNKGFTENLFIKKLKIEASKVKQIISILEKYKLLAKTEIELDDEIQTIYYFKPTPSFIAFLIFAKEMIKKPGHFCYYSECRKKPYLQ